MKELRRSLFLPNPCKLSLLCHKLGGLPLFLFENGSAAPPLRDLIKDALPIGEKRKSQHLVGLEPTNSLSLSVCSTAEPQSLPWRTLTIDT